MRQIMVKSLPRCSMGLVYLPTFNTINAPCMVYLSTFTINLSHSWIGKYTVRPMQHLRIPSLRKLVSKKPSYEDGLFFNLMDPQEAIGKMKGFKPERYG